MKKLIFLILYVSIISLYGQDEKKLQLSGYISLMGSAKKEKSDSMFFPSGENKHKDVLVHNRLNIFWYPTSNLTFSVQMRNRFMWNEQFTDGQTDPGSIDNDYGWMQLSKNWLEKDSYLLNSNIDRLYIQYTKGNLEISLGRQRINWSKSFAWNPNDIFNTSSYFDFDYAEKPGSDAIRVQYYTGMVSSAEAVVKIDNKKNITAAGLYRNNILGYDFQFLSGIMNEEEFIIGGGWSGFIKGAGFRGEVTSILPYKDSSKYMHPMDDLIMACVSFDYSFSNSAYVMCEFLYSNSDVSTLSQSLGEAFSGQTTVRNLAFARLSSLVSASYPVHPLINLNLAGMYFYKINGYYFGPSIDFSIFDNLNLSVYWQYFNMLLLKENIPGVSDISINYLFCRFKYNF